MNNSHLVTNQRIPKSLRRRHKLVLLLAVGATLVFVPVRRSHAGRLFDSAKPTLQRQFLRRLLWARGRVLLFPARRVRERPLTTVAYRLSTTPNRWLSKSGPARRTSSLT